MAVRCKALKDENVYDMLLNKCHVEDQIHCTVHWQSNDLNIAVDHYGKFVCGVAETGCSIHVAILGKRLQGHFQSNGAQRKAFAQKMADALS